MPPNLAIEPCPHCGSNADVRPSTDVRFKCQMCGKARIPVDARLGAASKQANQLLKESHGARWASILWQLAGVGVGLGSFFGLLLFGIGAWAGFGLIGNSVALVFTLAPILAAVAFWSFSRKAKQTSEVKLEEAWQMATARIVQKLGTQLQPAQLAKAMGVDVDKATELLAAAEVHQLLALEDEPAADPSVLPPVRVRVAEDGVEQAALDEVEQAMGNLPTQAIRARDE